MNNKQQNYEKQKNNINQHAENILNTNTLTLKQINERINLEETDIVVEEFCILGTAQEIFQ